MPIPARNDKNTLLMKACGSKTGQWDPEPPDQWKYQMYHGDAIARVVGWVKSKTTAYSRSAFAVDEKGKVLTLKHMASDLGWKHKTAINIAVEAAQEGLIRIESNGKKDPGRIYLCADVPNIGRRKSKVNSSVQRNYPPYLLEQIERMSDVQRRKFEASYGAFWKWSKEAMGDGVAELRSYIEQAEDTTLQAFGLQKKRETKRRVKKTAIRVELPEVPDFVQTVQSEVCTKPESGIVQPKGATPKSPAAHTAPSTSTKAPGVLSSDTDKYKKPAAAAGISSTVGTTAPPPSLIPWMRDALMNYPGASGLAGKPDDTICRQCLNAGTPDEIAASLIQMHRAGKAPSKSWAWFTVEIIRQHIPERKTA